MFRVNRIFCFYGSASRVLKYLKDLLIRFFANLYNKHYLNFALPFKRNVSFLSTLKVNLVFLDVNQLSSRILFHLATWFPCCLWHEREKVKASYNNLKGKTILKWQQNNVLFSLFLTTLCTGKGLFIARHRLYPSYNLTSWDAAHRILANTVGSTIGESVLIPHLKGLYHEMDLAFDDMHSKF